MIRSASPSPAARIWQTERITSVRRGLIDREDVPNGGSDLGAGGVAAADTAGHRLILGLRTPESLDQAEALEQCEVLLGAIGGVGPDAARGVLGIGRPADLTTVARGRVGDDSGMDDSIVLCLQEVHIKNSGASGASMVI